MVIFFSLKPVVRPVYLVRSDTLAVAKLVRKISLHFSKVCNHKNTLPVGQVDLVSRVIILFRRVMYYEHPNPKQDEASGVGRAYERVQDCCCRVSWGLNWS